MKEEKCVNCGKPITETEWATDLGIIGEGKERIYPLCRKCQGKPLTKEGERRKAKYPVRKREAR